jgi:hypothetical protein
MFNIRQMYRKSFGLQKFKFIQLKFGLILELKNKL